MAKPVSQGLLDPL